MTTNQISEKGYWLFDAQETKEHFFDANVASNLLRFMKDKTPSLIYDFGCGNGDYVKLLQDNGMKAFGFDGNPTTSNIPYCSVQDLTDSSWSIPMADVVISFEVAEHVPSCFEDLLVGTLDRHVKKGGWLILSWAIEGQGGLGHVNCRNNDYVIRKYTSMGYEYDNEESMKFRMNAELSWFRNTIMLFRKV